MAYTVALEDELLREWHAFKHAQPHDTRLIEKLLQLYKPPHITCVAQLQRLGIADSDSALCTQLAQSGLIKQTLEELATLTRYKLLLAAKSGDFPRVCIHGDLLSNDYTLTCKPGVNRDKAHDFLRSLMANARDILVHDRFFENNWSSSLAFFQLIPKTSLTLWFGKSLSQEKISEIKRICSQWTIKPDTSKRYLSHHDRYILIDQDMEIVITSGIDYLFDSGKECTLVVRQVGAF